MKKYMRNKKLDKIKKSLVVLLLFSFFLSILAMPAIADENNKNDYKSGYNKGYNDGKKKGQKFCKQYGLKETLVKIPSKKNGWIKYSIDYRNGYENGFTEGYHQYRYNCLKNKK